MGRVRFENIFVTLVMRSHYVLQKSAVLQNTCTKHFSCKRALLFHIAFLNYGVGDFDLYLCQLFGEACLEKFHIELVLTIDRHAVIGSH